METWNYGKSPRICTLAYMDIDCPEFTEEEVKDEYSSNAEFIGEIYDNTDNAPHLSPELKAKDEARYQANQYAMKHGEPDAESFDCPEEQIEYYCDKFNLFFDINGNIITV